MKCKILVFGVLMFVTTLTTAQENTIRNRPNYSMYWNNYSLYNPANTGLDNKHFANITSRLNIINHWEFNEYPKYVSTNYETKIEKINSGIGFGYSYKNNYLLRNSQQVYLNYAYHLAFKKKNHLSVGLSVNYQSIYRTPYKMYDPEAWWWDGPPSEPIREGKVNVNVGLLYKTEKLKIGIGVTSINSPRFDNLMINNPLYINGLVSREFQLSKNFCYKPSIYISGVYYSIRFDMDNQLIFNEKYFLGLKYRYHKSEKIGVQFGTSIFKNFQIAYAFDLDVPTNLLSVWKHGWHEVSLSFKL